MCDCWDIELLKPVQYIYFSLSIQGKCVVLANFTYPLCCDPSSAAHQQSPFSTLLQLNNHDQRNMLFLVSAYWQTLPGTPVQPVPTAIKVPVKNAVGCNKNTWKATICRAQQEGSATGKTPIPFCILFTMYKIQVWQSEQARLGWGNSVKDTIGHMVLLQKRCLVPPYHVSRRK